MLTIKKSRPRAFGSGSYTSPASIIARSTPLANVTLRYSLPTPGFSNLKAGTRNLGAFAGRAGPIVGGGIAIYDTATSDNPWRTGFGHVFGFIGGAVGATAGVAASTPTGWTSAPILGTGGAILGSVTGQDFGHALYDLIFGPHD